MSRYIVTYKELLENIEGALELINSPKLKVLYLHGLNGSVCGRKPSAIRNAGYDIVAPSFPKDLSVVLALKIPVFFNKKKDEYWHKVKSIAKEAFCKMMPDVIVGSSMGAAISMDIMQDYPHIPQVLIAPAWKFFGVQPKLSDKSTILHGVKDNLVPPEDSKLLCKKNSDAKLLLVEDTHRVNNHTNKLCKVLENYAVELGKSTPEPVIIKGYNAILRPSGVMRLKNGEVLWSDDDEVMVDTKAKTLTKLPKTKIITPSELI